MTDDELRKKRLQLLQQHARAKAQGGSSVDSAALDDFKGKFTSFFDGAMQGGTFGLLDELAGVRGAILGANEGGERGFEGTMGERYSRERDKVRELLDNSQETNPTAFGVGNFTGAMVPGAMVAPLATGGSLLSTMGRSGVMGAVEGAMHGAGNADGDPLGPAAAWGAGVGGGLGVAAPAVVHGAGAAKNAILDPAKSVMNLGNKSRANRAIANTLRASKKTPGEVAKEIAQAAADGQPEYRLMDAMGVPGQRRASGITRTGGDAAAEIAEFLEKRQLGQGERVAGFVDDAFGFRGQGSGNTLPMDPLNPPPQTSRQVLSGPQTSAAQTKTALENARSATADAAYSKARGNAAPVDVRGALGVIDDRIGGMQGSNVAGDSIDGKLASYRSRLAADPAPDGEIARELSDFDRVLGVKQSIQDDIGAAVRAGRNNEARELGKLADALDQALEASSDMYRTANDGFREASKVIGAVDEGKAMARPGARSADTVSQFQAMTPDQQSAARIGYGDDLMAKIEANTSPTSNKAKPLQSPKRDAEAAAMALDPEAYARRLSRENDMWGTQNRALGGSRTADNQMDIEGAGEMTGGLMGAARSALNLQIGDAAAQVAATIGSAAKGQNEATREAIARILMSQDPQAALAPVLAQDMKTQGSRRVIEALLRNAGRESVLN